MRMVGLPPGPMAPFSPRQTLHSYRCLSLPGSSPIKKTRKMVGLAPAAWPPFTPRRRRRSTGPSPSVASEDAPPSLFEPHQILRKKEDLLKGVFLFFCGWWDSNPHGSSPSDFESDASAIPPHPRAWLLYQH